MEDNLAISVLIAAELLFFGHRIGGGDIARAARRIHNVFWGFGGKIMHARRLFVDGSLGWFGYNIWGATVGFSVDLSRG